MTLELALLQSLLYSLGPFFCYPWKPVINYFYGASYKVGYKHFWDQHQNPTNLAWHFVCLFFQVFGNFTFLHALDNAIPYFEESQRPFSTLTALLWCISLIPTKNCPTIVKFGSIFTIFIAFSISPYLRAEDIEKYGLIAFALVWLIHSLNYGFLKIRKDGLLILAVLIGKFILCRVLVVYASGIHIAYKKQCLVAFVLVMILISLKKDPVKEIVAVGAILSPAVSITTDTPMLYVLGLAFMATLLQGLSHSLSMEQATLIKIELTTADERDKVSYEYSHVVFFPNLLLNAIYDVAFKKKVSRFNGKKVA
jgi:hypothetical protein